MAEPVYRRAPWAALCCAIGLALGASQAQAVAADVVDIAIDARFSPSVANVGLKNSMGGLVGWHIVHELDRQVEVRQFVSVSTPWNGDPAARLGVWFSLAPLPMWVDLTPGSPALLEIHQGRLDTRFTLVYAVGANRSWSDGVVSRASATDPAMIRQAAAVDREVGTHMSMLQGQGADRLARLLSAR